LNKGEGVFLTIEDVLVRLKGLKGVSGEGSQEEKIRIVSEILQQSNPKEGKYILRIVPGKLRLGFGNQFLLEAFSIAFFGDKKYLGKIKKSYSVCTDIGELAEAFAEYGPKALGHFSIQLGRPIKLMLAQRVENFEELEERVPGKKAAEEKYDGERVQIPKNGNEIQAFSRRLENITSQYPDLIEAIRKSVLVNKIVLDGEIVAYIEGKKRNERIEELYSFQKPMQRRRKYEIEKYMKVCPVTVFFFDILYLEERTLLKKSYPMRKTLLEKYVKESGVVHLARRIATENLEEIEDFLMKPSKKDLKEL